MLQTRIKIIHKADGSERYVPQAKGFDNRERVWHYFAIPVFGWLLGIERLFWHSISGSNPYYSKGNAKKDIDNYIESIDATVKERVSRKTIKTTYQKYP